MMLRNRFTVLIIVLSFSFTLAVLNLVGAQSPRHIKVLVDNQQQVSGNKEEVQGTGGIIIRRGGAQPSGRVTAGSRQTTVQRSTGIFTLVQDGGESILTVSTRVPQIQVRLTPRISYFSAERSGAIDFTEATTELIVPDGQPVSLGGSTSRIHEITRQILGYSEHTSSSETELV